ncbi:hypothetical protein [Bradyrhizobium diazoefficiens]
MPSATSLQNFKSSAVGQKLRPIVEDPNVVFEMKILVKHNLAPMRAVDDALRRLEVDNTGKQFVGAWIRELMETEGFEPDDIRNMPKGSYVKKATRYRKRVNE